jgi:hypothetical protein
VNGILGERDVVVAGLADPGGGAARIAVDGSDHLFVAMPRGLANSPGMDAGMLLRFRRDGSVPPDNAAVSPVYSTGASDPAALAWSPSEDSLWLVDSVSDRIARYRLHLDAARAIPADHLETLNPGVSMLPITSITFNPFDVQRPTNPVIVAGHPSDVLNVSDDGVGTLHVTPLPSMLMGGEPIAAVNNLDEIDVVVRVSDVNAPIASRIVRLRRQFPLY